MKKLLTTLALTGALASSMLAEIESNVDSSKESKGFCQGKHSNTGCFVGVSVGATFGENYFYYLPELSSSVDRLMLTDSSLVAAPINVDFGYQWYYAQNQGVRVKAYLGYTNYKVNFPKHIANRQEVDFSLSSHALQYGLEASWLYDFIASEKHNFGLNLGTGFEITHLLTTSGTMQDLKLKGEFGTSIAWASSIGLHYFYKAHHQFFISYHYRSYSTAKNGAKVSIQDSLSSQNSVDIMPLGNLIISPRHMVSLSYAYKF